MLFLLYDPLHLFVWCIENYKVHDANENNKIERKKQE